VKIEKSVTVLPNFARAFVAKAASPWRQIRLYFKSNKMPQKPLYEGILTPRVSLDTPFRVVATSTWMI
jgi:hypothetical protein